MAWQYLPLTYRVLSPIHIGYRSVGIIDRTRYYAPAKNFWAATTASLTTRLHRTPRANDYRAVGELAQRCLRFAYFFLAARPAEKPMATLKRYLPEYRNGRTVYLEHPGKQEADMEAIFVNSYMSTALDPNCHAAAERLLHEIEYLQPHVRIEGDCWETHLVGGVWISPESDPSGVEIPLEGETLLIRNLPILDHLSIGGERGHGFGRLQLTEDHTDYLGLGSWEVQEGGPSGLLILPPEQFATTLAHVTYEPGKHYEGVLEPVVGREWDTDKGAGRLLAKGTVYIAPGGRFLASAYAVDGLGFWSAMP
ncbi:MAG: hypothetical protein HXY46_00525 [Syntrophaceae bacterium]|nr:hypothetical protein [Syntrophaceae bacterium]